jgi:hypothetical protein
MHFSAAPPNEVADADLVIGGLDKNIDDLVPIRADPLHIKEDSLRTEQNAVYDSATHRASDLSFFAGA